MNNVQSIGSIGAFLHTEKTGLTNKQDRPESPVRVLPVVQRLLIGYLLFMLFPHVIGAVQTAMHFVV